MITGAPTSRPAYATPRPWLPPDAVTKPRPASSRDRVSALLVAPRALNEPETWRDSSLSVRPPPGGGRDRGSAATRGVRRTWPAMRWRACSISWRPIIPRTLAEEISRLWPLALRLSYAYTRSHAERDVTSHSRPGAWRSRHPRQEKRAVATSVLNGLGQALRWLRERHGRKQYQVADTAGITKGMLSSYETGR